MAWKHQFDHTFFSFSLLFYIFLFIILFASASAFICIQWLNTVIISLLDTFPKQWRILSFVLYAIFFIFIYFFPHILCFMHLDAHIILHCVLVERTINSWWYELKLFGVVIIMLNGWTGEAKNRWEIYSRRQWNEMKREKKKWACCYGNWQQRDWLPLCEMWASKWWMTKCVKRAFEWTAIVCPKWLFDYVSAPICHCVCAALNLCKLKLNFWSRSFEHFSMTKVTEESEIKLYWSNGKSFM